MDYDIFASFFFFRFSVKEIVPNEEYSIGFTIAGQQYHLHVHLTNNFPNEIPKLVIKPSSCHPWVSSNNEIINAPGLVNVSIFQNLYLFSNTDPPQLFFFSSFLHTQI